MNGGDRPSLGRKHEDPPQGADGNPGERAAVDLLLEKKTNRQKDQKYSIYLIYLLSNLSVFQKRNGTGLYITWNDSEFQIPGLRLLHSKIQTPKYNSANSKSKIQMLNSKS